VTSLYQTRQVRDRPPERFDEALNVHWYLENVLFDVVEDLYAGFERAFEGTEVDAVEIPELFEFRSWAGGDRGGNPYVTSDVTTRTLQR